jgi:hypothetical protein
MEKAPGMRISETIVAAGLLSTTTALLAPREALADPSPQRDANWGVLSNVTMLLGAATVTLMPRVYYSDPEATVGWKGRFHISVLAPAMTMTAFTWLLDTQVREAIQSPRPGCEHDPPQVFPLSASCASFGGPSTQAYASWGATGAGTGIFLVDTLKYSKGRLNVPSLLLDVILPLSLSVVTSMGRVVGPGNAEAYEDPGQVAAGALTGFASGLVLGGAYALLQRPACPYGNSIYCW